MSYLIFVLISLGSVLLAYKLIKYPKIRNILFFIAALLLVSVIFNIYLDSRGWGVDFDIFHKSIITGSNLISLKNEENFFINFLFVESTNGIILLVVIGLLMYAMFKITNKLMTGPNGKVKDETGGKNIGKK